MNRFPIEIKDKHMGLKLGLSGLMTVIFLLIYMSNVFSYADTALQDWFFQREKQTSEEVVVIGVTAQDLETYGMWPWDRSTWVNVLSAINSNPETSPAAIGMAVSFYGWSQPISDAALAVELSKENVVLACYADLQSQVVAGNSVFGQETQLSVSDVSYPYFYPSEDIQLGHINILSDSDGILRHDLLSVETPQGGTIYSMAYETFSTYNDYHGYETDFTPELDNNNFWYVDYSATAGGYLNYTISDILNGDFSQEDLTGKIVLIGLYDTTLMDYYRPSIDSSTNMYGIEFIANCINAMLNDVEIRAVHPATEVIILIISTFLITFFSLHLSLSLVAVSAFIYCGVGSGIIMFVYDFGILYPPFFFVTGLLCCFLVSVIFNYWFQAYSKKHLSDVFKQYVDPKVMAKLVESDLETLHAPGANKEVAVLFVDLRGFTRMSERLDAATVVTILNAFFTLADESIRKYDGTLDKFIGDCAMAYWGAPNELKDPAYQACCAGMEMIRRSTQLSAEMKEKHNVDVSFGVGIHYGHVIVGNVGSHARLDYTVIGDTVNTAARLESVAPPKTIFISGSVAQKLGSRAKTTHMIDSLPLKGKKAPVEIYVLDELKQNTAMEEQDHV